MNLMFAVPGRADSYNSVAEYLEDVAGAITESMPHFFNTARSPTFPDSLVDFSSIRFEVKATGTDMIVSLVDDRDCWEEFNAALMGAGK